MNGTHSVGEMMMMHVFPIKAIVDILDIDIIIIIIFKCNEWYSDNFLGLKCLCHSDWVKDEDFLLWLILPQFLDSDKNRQQQPSTIAQFFTMKYWDDYHHQHDDD